MTQRLSPLAQRHISVLTPTEVREPRRYGDLGPLQPDIDPSLEQRLDPGDDA
jgi:hypothetical protein